MAVHLRVLGCGDAFGTGGRFQTCFHVSAGATRFLIDCGATATVAMHRWEVDRGAVDAVLLSHLHGDHMGGLPFFVLDAHFIVRRTAPLLVAGPGYDGSAVPGVVDGAAALPARGDRVRPREAEPDRRARRDAVRGRSSM